MATKRSVTVELMGERLKLRTTEPEEALAEHVERVNTVLAEIARQSNAVDTLRLFALGLLFMGRELNMLETRYAAFCDGLESQLHGLKARLRRA